MRVRLSDDAISVIITALDFCLVGEGEIFTDDDGFDDPAKIAVARDTLHRLVDGQIADANAKARR